MLALVLVLVLALVIPLFAVHMRAAPVAAAAAGAERFAARPLCNPYLGPNVLRESKHPKHANCVYRFNDRIQFQKGAKVGDDLIVNDRLAVGTTTVRDKMAVARDVKARAHLSKRKLQQFARKQRQFRRETLPGCADGERTHKTPGCYYCPTASGGTCTINTGAGGSEDSACGQPFCGHTQIRSLASTTTYPMGVEISPGASLATEPDVPSMTACQETCRLHGPTGRCKAVMYNHRSQECLLKAGTRLGGGVDASWQGRTIATKA